MMTVDDVLRMASSAGVSVLVDGYDLVLEHDVDPPANLVAMLRHFKSELVSALRMRQAEQRGLITQGSTTTSRPRQPASAPIAVTGRDRSTHSSCCSSEPTGARCTAHATRHGLLSARLRPAKLSALRPTQQVGTRNHQIQGLIRNDARPTQI